jgi:hypothetical protein
MPQGGLKRESQTSLRRDQTAQTSSGIPGIFSFGLESFAILDDVGTLCCRKSG